MTDYCKVMDAIECCFHGQECCINFECPYWIDYKTGINVDLKKCQEQLKKNIIKIIEDLKDEKNTLLECQRLFVKNLKERPLAILCKNCKCYRPESNDYGYCERRLERVKGKWFCGDGEANEII